MVSLFITGLLWFCSLLQEQTDNQLNSLITNSITYFIDNQKEYGDPITYLCVDGIPSSVQPYNTDYLLLSLHNKKGIRGELKRELKKGIISLFCSINLSEADVVITISSRRIQLTHNQIIIKLIDWTVYQYHYSYDQKQWELVNLERNGV